jgi:hypothetical protein
MLQSATTQSQNSSCRKGYLTAEFGNAKVATREVAKGNNPGPAFFPVIDISVWPRPKIGKKGSVREDIFVIHVRRCVCAKELLVVDGYP